MKRLTRLIAPLALLLALFPALIAQANSPVTGAAFTTINPTVDTPPAGTNLCLNGNGLNNCNIYTDKSFVWFNGGPSTAYPGDGTYFFAVLDPGGQRDPNDGSTGNLSSNNDAYTNRTFSVSSGTVSYNGSHTFDSNKIRLMPYDNTTNPGGVYIMAICLLSGGNTVKPSECKYDAFKVQAATSQVIKAKPLTISKTADGADTRTFTWKITKGVDQTLVNQSATSDTLTYTVGATHDDGKVSGVKVTGTITVNNPNPVSADIGDVTDQLSNSTVCAVTDAVAQTVPPGTLHFPIAATSPH